MTLTPAVVMTFLDEALRYFRYCDGTTFFGGWIVRPAARTDDHSLAMALHIEEHKAADDDGQARPEEVVKYVHLRVGLFEDGVVQGQGVVVAEEGRVAVRGQRVGEFVDMSSVLLSCLVADAHGTLDQRRNSKSNLI